MPSAFETLDAFVTFGHCKLFPGRTLLGQIFKVQTREIDYIERETCCSTFVSLSHFETSQYFGSIYKTQHVGSLDDGYGFGVCFEMGKNCWMPPLNFYT